MTLRSGAAGKRATTSVLLKKKAVISAGKKSKLYTVKVFAGAGGEPDPGKRAFVTT